MAFWVYKCNAKNGPHQRDFGDWNDFFANESGSAWGTTELIPELRKLEIGDTVIAHQTDRQELVGTARVIGRKRRKSFFDVVLEPLAEIHASMGDLKRKDSRIAQLPAYAQGRIQTIYEIDDDDAKYLLETATKLEIAPRN